MYSTSKGQQVLRMLSSPSLLACVALGSVPTFKWLTHRFLFCTMLSLRSGREPEYTSSHSQFMDTCDYIWYTEAALRSSTQLDQQQLKPSGQQLLPSNAITDNDQDAAARPGDNSSGEPAVGPTGYALRPVAVLVPPDGMRLPKGLPSRWLGSDHVCLVADFQLTPQRA